MALYGKYSAEVIDVDDPQELGRIRVYVFSLSLETGWCSLHHPYKGWWYPPDIGDKVWVEFEEGDINRPIFAGFQGLDSESISDYKEPVDRKVLQTSCWRVELENKKDEEYLLIKSRNDKMQILIDKSGKEILISNEEGNKSLFKMVDGKVEVLSKSGEIIIKTDSGDIVLETGNGKLDIKATGDINIKTVGNVIIKEGSDMITTANRVARQLNRIESWIASVFMSFVSQVSAHTHIGGPVGTPTTPPIPPPTASPLQPGTVPQDVGSPQVKAP